MYERILLPVTRGDPAARARRFAKAYAEQYDADLHVLHCIHAVQDAPNFSQSHTYWEQREATGQDFIESVLEEFEDAEFETIGCVQHGSPSYQIVKYAEANDIDLIIMGTHGYSGLSRLIHGSVTEQVIRQSAVPVIAIPPSPSEEVEEHA